ncbi:MAG TPA: glycoside hydrolase domain-containing protein [Candidatus Sulfotelmatobacter sp.]|nr:glycoside hydrolase domain-containing protein [Candidatus Sulfotelmatobacter sp.]
MPLFPRQILSFLALVMVAGLAAAQSSYLGFDRNVYPGDANLKALRQTFTYAGYWLNNPPGERENTWVGHRATVDAAGFGFLVLFNGRLYAELKSETNAARLGKSDGANAAAAARREGFAAATIIFLDQEQGGVMLPEQKAYIFAWVDTVTAAGFRAGIYCSGMVSTDSNHVVTADDIRAAAGGRNITYWVTNDACPPSPGCAFPREVPDPRRSGVGFAEVWQFAQSPERKDVAAHCTRYARDGNCYPPNLAGVYVDVSAATSADPSRGRSH